MFCIFYSSHLHCTFSHHVPDAKDSTMHALFEEVLAKRDLSKAGMLFSLEDKEIEEDLSQVVQEIHNIADSDEYEISDNDQSVVEICITRVNTAIR